MSHSSHLLYCNFHLAPTLTYGNALDYQKFNRIPRQKRDSIRLRNICFAWRVAVMCLGVGNVIVCVLVSVNLRPC